MKPAAIVNPRCRRMLEEWPSGMERRFTEKPGHAAALARELAEEGFDPIIAAGGDGTVNEVANGILASGRDVGFGVIPLGSACDFARVLAGGAARRIDAVRVRCRDAVERCFVNVAGIGLAAEAAAGVRRIPHLPPRLRYLAAVAPKLAGNPGYRIRLWLDDAEAGEFHFTTAALANGRYQGGGILIAPDAAIDDGRMNLTLVEHIGLIEVLANLRLLYSGTIYTHPKVRHWQAARVRMEGSAPVELDGEPAGELPLEAEVLPQALRLVYV